jgi:hypothetical protein
MNHKTPVYRAEFSPDGAWVVTASGNTAQVWDAVNGEPIGDPMEHKTAFIAQRLARTANEW